LGLRSKCQSVSFGVIETSPSITFLMATLWSHMAYAFWVCQWDFGTLPPIFLIRFYFKMWHISMIFFPRRCLNCFGHFVFMCNLLSSLSLLAGFDKRIMQICGNIMGLGSWESFQGPLMRCRAWLMISLNGISLFFMEDYAQIFFLGNWALVATYLCYKLHIFYIPILEYYVSQVERAHTCFSHVYVKCEMTFLL